ncbi:MAG: ECF transporter S component [Roseburia sp.]|nr:ECF transporter S component [Roseburia sp.]
MAAAVYTASAFLQIPIPTAIGSTRLHMGNVMCLLSGMLLGPVPGGLAAGTGSVLFDLTNPAYVASAPFTFAFKFIMAWLCGKIISNCRMGLKTRFISGATAGAFIYVLLYISKTFVENRFVLGLPSEAVMLTVAQKSVVSGINAGIAVIVAVPLGLALRPAVAKFIPK